MVTKHGMSRTRVYRIWIGMHARCTNPNHCKWHMYGANGVSVCARWKSFENFFEDMGHPPTLTHSIDRYPNKGGNYEPGNCRWATKREQMENTARTRYITHNGKTQCLKAWARELGISHKTLWNRIERGWTIAEAMNQSGRPYKRLPQ